ncbi:hypothetical protein NEOLI_000037 [Neolecta irregularis DAH-3]|uniref:SAP domain-containing protein n=1 Tax=Neolecta irregularis (strain DAH-3) TaxID=1198029 RepID=A0A1U7LWU8_NEOID|nr:hypothetical protein NEOLI_000037 [Neolecta irregularis DAH-3]|eukprot:OLL27022.1 hypothetical protein NEOLI_000037 [Neolecta irregularis DAH-3]
MSTLNFIKTANKRALQRMCEERNLDSFGLRTDLEARLQRYFEENGTESEESQPEEEQLAPQSLFTRSTLISRARVLLPTAGDESKIVVDLGHSPRKSSLRMPRKVLRTASSALRDTAEDHDLPSSPKQVARYVENSTANIARDVKSALHWDTAVDKGKRVREMFSNALAIISVVEFHEMFWLLRKLIPLTFLLHLPGEHFSAIQLPDLFILLSADYFWKPFLLWLGTSVVLPTIAALFVNPQHNQHSVDPVTFSIAKLVLTYIVFIRQWTFTLVGYRSGDIIKAAISSDILWLGGAISLVYAFYEAAILPRR